MGNLRTRLLLSHLILIGIMLVVIIGGVASVVHLGRSIDRILKDNIKSVYAAQDMKEALERQDSAATFYLAGQVERARRQYREYAPKFEDAFHKEDTNITEPGERQMADDIGRWYEAYRRNLATLLYAVPPMAPQEARAHYFGTLEPAFERIKGRAQDVLRINQDAIQRASNAAKAEARRASWTGIGVAASAFALALVLAVTMIGAALAPLQTLARQAEEIGAGHLNQRIELHRDDEIGVLAGAFNRMAENLREARRQEAERLHRAERMSDAAIDSLYDPVVVTDAQGLVVHLNRAAEGLFGPADRATGRPVARVVSEARIAEAVGRAVHQEHVSAEEDEAGMVPLQVGSAQRTYRLRVTPMRDEEANRLGAVAVLEDVTHLRELDLLKTEFIGVASHELRTPVTSLLLSAQLLEQGAVGALTPEQKEVVAAQKDDLLRLERMMRDLLEVTRLESGVAAPRLEIVSPHDLVRSAIESVVSQAEAKGRMLGASVPDLMPPVRADRAQIGRVLLNLLSNAIRHTPEGGSIQLEVRRDDGKVAFAVSDSGVGIPPEHLPRIFERFVQVPGATRGGAGLGLSIARTIVQAHGGEIMAASEPGRGSTFTFTLPAIPGAEAAKEGE